jgi:hypothetical protein
MAKFLLKTMGQGMSIDIIKNVWLEPGSDYKEKLFKTRQVSPKYRRLPLGEKGIVDLEYIN